MPGTFCTREATGRTGWKLFKGLVRGVNAEDRMVRSQARGIVGTQLFLIAIGVALGGLCMSLAFEHYTGVKAASLTTGKKFAQDNRVSATVLAIGPRHAGAMQMRTGDTSVGISLPGVYDVPAALQLECFLENTGDGSLRCVYHGPLQPAFVATDSVLPLPNAGGTLNFQVSDVHPIGTPSYLRVRVRTAIAPDILARLRAGDSDSQVPDYSGAWVGRVESTSGADIVLRLPAQQFSNGWKYRNQWLKVNGAIRFETPRAVINGTVVDLAPVEQAASQ